LGGFYFIPRLYLVVISVQPWALVTLSCLLIRCTYLFSSWDGAGTVRMGLLERIGQIVGVKVVALLVGLVDTI
jgi:hypothetical protein